MKRTVGIILVCVLLLAAITVVSVRITDVEITGNQWYTNEQLENLLFPTAVSKNSTYCFIRGILKKKETIPFVQDYKITFVSPVKVEVIVYEKSIVGYISYMGSNMYFDKDGIIVESSAKKLEGIPLISGLKFGEIVLYKPLPVQDKKIFSAILNLTQSLSTYNIAVDMIRYDASGNATLVIQKINVLLGGSSEMNGKISELANILSQTQIKDMRGTLDLQNYDPNSSNITYSFKER